MDDYLDINLRDIVKKIISKWYWVVLSGFVVGLTALLISYFQKDIFQATTRFVITEPSYYINFENQYQTTNLEKPSEEVLRSIVLSDDIISSLFDLWESDSKGSTTLREFKQNYLSVEIGNEERLVSLSVETESREQCALIANAWVDLAITAINDTYYGLETDQVNTIENQMAEALSGLTEAGQALIDFANTDNSKILESDLNNILVTRDDNNLAIRTINSALEDAKALREVLNQEPPTSVVDPSYHLSFLLIQVKVLNSSNSTVSPYDVVLDSANQSDDILAGELITMIGNWSTAMADRVLTLQEENEKLSTSIVSLQTEIQDLATESNMLLMDYSRQQEAYNIVATKYEEVRLTFPDDKSGYVSLISKAMVPEPEDRLPHNTVRNTLIAAAAAGIMAIAGIVICDWWSCSGNPDPENEA